MQVINNESIWCVDVDDTLVHCDPSDTDLSGSIKIMCPYMKQYVSHTVNNANIRLLKEKKQRGATIVVWSQGGYKWALAVVRALGLSDDVDLIMTKPSGIIDDLPAEKWMPKNVWLDNSSNYKNSNNQKQE